MKTKTLLVPLLSFMIMTFYSCSDVDSESISQIKLNETSLEIYKWNETALIASTLSDEPINKNIIWSSSDPKIVSVNEKGEIKALKKGNAIITVKNEKSSATCDVTVNPNVYVAGNSTANSFLLQSDSTFAKIWKNNEEIILPGTTKHTHTQSVFVSDGDVYVTGYDFTGSGGNRTCILWKNGGIILRTNTISDGYFRSVYVDGEDVYVAGYISEPGAYKAKLWKNGEEVNLPCEENSSYAHSVFVSNGDVYVAGSGSSSSLCYSAKLWKNGEEINLPSQYSNNRSLIQAYSVFVSDGDVYVTGSLDRYNNIGNHDMYAAILWKNGEEIILNSEFNRRPTAKSVYVCDGDVYVVGHLYENSSYIPVLWKNGEETILPSDPKLTFAESVFVSGNDVYVAGYENENAHSVAKLWKNGKVTNLTDKDKIKHGFAYSVFVEE